MTDAAQKSVNDRIISDRDTYQIYRVLFLVLGGVTLLMLFTAAILSTDNAIATFWFIGATGVVLIVDAFIVERLYRTYKSLRKVDSYISPGDEAKPIVRGFLGIAFVLGVFPYFIGVTSDQYLRDMGSFIGALIGFYGLAIVTLWNWVMTTTDKAINDHNHAVSSLLTARALIYHFATKDFTNIKDAQFRKTENDKIAREVEHVRTTLSASPIGHASCLWRLNQFEIYRKRKVANGSVDLNNSEIRKALIEFHIAADREYEFCKSALKKLGHPVFG